MRCGPIPAWLPPPPPGGGGACGEHPAQAPVSALPLFFFLPEVLRRRHSEAPAGLLGIHTKYDSAPSWD